MKRECVFARMVFVFSDETLKRIHQNHCSILIIFFYSGSWVTQRYLANKILEITKSSRFVYKGRASFFSFPVMFSFFLYLLFLSFSFFHFHFSVLPFYFCFFLLVLYYFYYFLQPRLSHPSRIYFVLVREKKTKRGGSWSGLRVNILDPGGSYPWLTRNQ